MSCYFFIALLFLLHQLSSGACLCSCQKRWDNVTLWHLLVWCISGALKWSPRSEKKILSRGKEERNYCVGGSSKAICDYRGNEPSLTWSFVLYFLSTHTKKSLLCKHDRSSESQAGLHAHILTSKQDPIRQAMGYLWQPMGLHSTSHEQRAISTRDLENHCLPQMHKKGWNIACSLFSICVLNRKEWNKFHLWFADVTLTRRNW